MGDPDWDRYLVTAGKPGPALGDPTRWGATVPRVIPQLLTAQLDQTPQILQVACGDPYSRVWSIAGNLEAHSDFWDTPLDGSAGAGVVSFWASAMRIRMGVGQNTLLHTINLRQLIEVQSPFYFEGSQGGEVLGPGVTRVRPFLISGGIVANNISIQLVNFFQYNSLPASAYSFNTALQVSSFDPGTGKVSVTPP